MRKKGERKHAAAAGKAEGAPTPSGSGTMTEARALSDRNLSAAATTSFNTAAGPAAIGPGIRNSPLRVAATARRQRLFSARAFSASRHRSPFLAAAAEAGDSSSTSSEKSEAIAASSTAPQRAPRRRHFGQRDGRRNYAEGPIREEEGGIAKQQTLEEEEEDGGIALHSGAHRLQRTNIAGGDDFSDIEDIELGEMRPSTSGEPDTEPERMELAQQRSLDSLAAAKFPRKFRRRWKRPTIQPLMMARNGGGRGGGLAEVEERTIQRMERRKQPAETEQELHIGSWKKELEVDAGAEQDDESLRAFSPRLDIDLAPQLESRPLQLTTSRAPSRASSTHSITSAAHYSPRQFVASPSELRKPSSALNGSIGSGVPVPAPPQITVTSPQDIPIRKPIIEELQIEQPPKATEQPPPGMNPSLIKGFSRSIWRFRARNRINDEAALAQANFMSKFGMSGTGIQIAPGGVVASQQEEEQSRHRGFGRVRYAWGKLVFDANESYFYRWNALVSTAYVYNLLVVIARSVFVELAAGRLWMLWLMLDLFMDSIFLVDMFVRSRTGYLEQGLLVRDCAKIRALYVRSRLFLVDCASILPLDYFAGVVLGRPQPILRLNRLLRRERIQRFMEQTETRTSMPNAFRVGVVVWYIAVIIHWNACFYFMISENIGLGSDPWVYGLNNKQSLPPGINDTLTRRYIYSFYWSTLILTTIGEVPGPQQNVEFAFVTIDLMCGVLIFATIVGNVGSMIANISADRTEFQNRIDSIKQYMDLRGVGKQLEVRVIKWFDYLWANKQGLMDAQVLKVLPDKLQAEIAMHVHFETLRKVRIFQDCEAGLLAELVLKLQLQVFSPGDYVCRKGDIGREMYIVKRGMLQVVADDGLKVFATLSEGAVFGELSILNIAGSKNGNRRTANVRSVGYTDLFVLNKSDLWIALREYPEARKILINKGRELLRKDNLLDENAPAEQKTAEELGEELQNAVHVLQVRIARLIAEHTNTETKLRDRIEELEGRLAKYRVLLVDEHGLTGDEHG